MSYCTEISWNLSGQLKKWDFCEINLHGIANDGSVDEEPFKWSQISQSLPWIL